MCYWILCNPKYRVFKTIDYEAKGKKNIDGT